MGDTVSHRTLIREARREIRALRRPPTMRSDVWHGVRDLLDALAGYLPEVWPSQRTLARKLQVSQPAVHRRVCAARKAGLIVTTTHDHPAWRDGLDYRLVCLSEGLKTAISRYGSRYGSESEGRSSPSEKITSLAPSGLVHGSGSALAATQENVAFMSDYRDDPEPIGADPYASLPQRSVRPVDQGAWLAKLFDECWRTMARSHREWRSVTPSKRGMAVGYIKGVMLEQVDVDIAEAYVRAFAPAVAEGRIEVKEGQIPFERFTAWWGREEIEDPQIASERKAENAAIMEAYWKLRAEREAEGG